VSPVTFDLAAPFQRSVICGIADGGHVIPPDGESVTLYVDPASAAARCAGFWATGAGWHHLRDGERSQPFLIPGPEQTAGLSASALREATLTLAAGDSPSRTGTPLHH